MAEKLAIFDVDGTQFKSACLEKVIDEAIRQGVFRAEGFAKAMAQRRLWQADNNERVYQSYLHNLIDSFITSIAGVSVADFQTVTDRMVAEQRVRLFSYPKQLAQLLKTTHRLVAVSGSPLPVVEPFLAGLGFDQIVGSRYETRGGFFTGNAKGVDKDAVLLEVAGTDGQISLGIGDTVSDLAVLNRAMCPIAFNPSATLRRTAIEKGWFIVIEQKDAITQLLPSPDGGYKVVFDRSPSVILDQAGIDV